MKRINAEMEICSIGFADRMIGCLFLKWRVDGDDD